MSGLASKGWPNRAPLIVAVGQASAPHVAYRRAEARRGADPRPALRAHPARRHAPATRRALDCFRLAVNEAEGPVRKHAADRERAAGHALAVRAVTGVDQGR